MKNMEIFLSRFDDDPTWKKDIFYFIPNIFAILIKNRFLKKNCS